MIKNFDEIKKQLQELSAVINSFKSEAVQLRLIELVFKAVQEAPSGDKEDVEEKLTGKRIKSPSGRRSTRSKPASSEKPTAKPRVSGRPGGKATLARLYDEGFFKKAKTIKQLVEHCELNLALKYPQSDFSGALARYVRNGKLKRTKNADKQYEYSQV